ncbi:prepilin peptidase [Butyrivibrio sp. JL13D10]|uniref:prepilin peptidase n=1 Tax=Butyrivibrio sp. JL13D10 TaxID=3236815 RepID=UPI0038B699CB
MAENIYSVICIALFGLVFGSFLNCMAMRIVRKEDFVKARSHCMSCSHELGAIDLIPVISYLLQRGRCRYCKAKISVRYPITELSFMALSVLLYVVNGSDPVEFLKKWILVGFLFAIALVDLESSEIPDGVLIAMMISWMFFSAIELYLGRYTLVFYGKRLLSGVMCGAVMLAISILMDELLKKESLGGGDIKLMAIIAIYLGFVGTYELILFSCVIGILFAVVRRIIKPKASNEFPFGPSIAAAAYIVLLFGDEITAWYFKML